MYLPWSSIGVDVLDTINVYEALQQAGVNFNVEVVPGQYEVDGKTYKTDRFFYIIRTDTNEVLGQCKGRFKPVQNSVLVDIIQPLIDEGVARLDTIGVFNNGEKVWILAKLGDCSFSVDSDNIDSYLLLVNGHDGTTSIMIGVIPFRIQCSNMFPHIMERMVKIKHTENADRLISSSMARIKKIIKGIPKYRKKLEVMSNTICYDAEGYVKEVFDLHKEEKLSTRSQNKINSIVDKLGGTVHSYYDVFNAITNYLSFEAGRTVETRLSSLWLKGNAKVAKKALDLGVEKCTILNV